MNATGNIKFGLSQNTGCSCGCNVARLEDDIRFLAGLVQIHGGMPPHTIERLRELKGRA